MKTVKKIKQVLEYVFLAIGAYFGICVLCAGKKKIGGLKNEQE